MDKILESYDEFLNKESITEATISADQMEMAGKKLIRRIDIGAKFHGEIRNRMKHTSKKAVLTVTGFGPRANAFNVFEVEDEDGNQLYLRVDVMYGTSYKVAKDARANWENADGMVLDKIVLESKTETGDSVNEISHSSSDVDFKAIEKSIMKVGHDNKAQSEFKKKLYYAVSDLLSDAPDDVEVTLKFMWTVLNELQHSNIYKR